MKTISKTDYMRYLECPLYGWLAKHKRELMEDGENLNMVLGNETEKLAHGLSDEGVEVKGYYEAGAKKTHSAHKVRFHDIRRVRPSGQPLSNKKPLRDRLLP